MPSNQNVPMNKSKVLWIAIATHLVVGCTTLNEPKSQALQPGMRASDTTTAQANEKTTKSKGILENWEFGVTRVKSEGQVIKGEYITYEAAEAWTVVSVTVKNISGKRQRVDDAFGNLLFSNLVDSKGNKYTAKELKFNYNTDLNSKPFSVGETRSFDLLFDAPRGVKANHLLIGLLESDSIRLQP